MDCGTTLVKYILFIFNTLVSVLGILAIVYGVITMNQLGVVDTNNQTGIPYTAFSFGLITIGSIIVFISFLGCCGAIREDVCMTMCYAVFMLVLLILQVSLIVLLWINKENIVDGVSNAIQYTWDKRSQDPTVFETMQVTLNCCGVNGFSDYAKQVQIPPDSCCPPNTSCINPLNFYPGCESKLKYYISDKSDHLKHFGIGLIAIELVGFIFACCLANNVRNYKRRNAY